MKFGSVCSGIEAATVAWDGMGWESVFFSEIEAFPSALLKEKYKNTPNVGDMTKITKEFFNDNSIDLLVGGTPCQSFSVAGLRKGMADPRGNLALVFLGLVDKARPRWVVWENVPGVLSSNEGRDFGAFVGGLAELGYGWSYRVLDAQYFGVPQRRRRVFVVGHLGDWRPAAAVLFERASVSWNPPPSREKGKGPATCFTTSPDGSGREDDGTPTIDARAKDARAKDGPRRNQGGTIIKIPEISPALKARDYKGPSSDGDGDGAPIIPVVFPIQDKATRHNGARGIGSGNGLGIGEDGDPSPTITTGDKHAVAVQAIPINTQIAMRSNKLGEGTGLGVGKKDDPAFTLQAGHSHAVAFQSAEMRLSGKITLRDQVPTLKAETKKGDTESIVLYENHPADSRLKESAQAPTISARAGTGGGNLPLAKIGMQVRRLTPRECERLQGFPDDYTLVPFRGKPASDAPRYKALGNSMAVPVMRWIGERIQLVDKLCIDRAKK